MRTMLLATERALWLIEWTRKMCIPLLTVDLESYHGVQQHSFMINETNGTAGEAFLLLLTEEDCYRDGAVVTYCQSPLYE